MRNPVGWLEIATIDIERAKKFYTKVFNIEFQFLQMPNSKMYMFGDTDNPGCAGTLVESDDFKPSKEGVVIYFSCEDVNNELKVVKEVGGTILIDKTNIGEYGFFAQIIDSEGNRIGLHSNK